MTIFINVTVIQVNLSKGKLDEAAIALPVAFLAVLK